VPDVLPLFLIGAAIAAVLAYGGIAAAMPWLKARALAKPNARSSHSVPTPQGGGIVVVPAALIAAGIALATEGHDLPVLHLAAVGAAALALSLIGFMDDVRGLGIAPRLLAQTSVVVIAVALLPAELRVTPLMPLWLERAGLIGGTLWFVNLFNFMDGIDLISAVETFGITLGVAILAAIGTVPAVHGTVAVALLGAMAGFAPWNRPRARLFLGDAGSIPLGFLLAVLLIHVAAAGALAAAVILPLYYLADATITLIRRAARRERVWEAHRSHFYQQAMGNGWSVAEIVGRIGALDAVLVALAVASALHGGVGAGVAAVLVAATAVGATLWSLARKRRPPP